mmetsp:Transcript_16316/g.23806  ORF Transcript_16316/g.23806 Transcript_16316/m.23806 type:complete len:375 (-) Transcript_16316:82-1206(-)
MIKILPTSNSNHRLTTYKNSITGETLTKTFGHEFNLDQKAAIEFGRYLQSKQIIQHVTNKHTLSDDANHYFRLQPYQTPHILNSFRIWTDRIDPNSMAIVARLTKLMSDIQSRANIGGDVDLNQATRDESYPQFQEEVCELQGIDMTHMDVSTKTAFIINVYNLFIKHAQMKFGVPQTISGRTSFFMGIKIDIGGHEYSFHELENGLLRANAVPPYSFRRVFDGDDERLEMSLEKVDPRIHFALNCGARSCPPVKKFTSDALEEELRIVALAFCEQEDNVKIDEGENAVALNTIFKWYRPDFANSVAELPEALVGFLRGERKETLQRMVDGANGKNIKVKFIDYDWGSDVVGGEEFDASALKPDQFSLKNCCSC